MIVGHGLQIRERNAGLANEGAFGGFKINAIEKRVLPVHRKAIANAVCIDREGHHIRNGQFANIFDIARFKIDDAEISYLSFAANGVHIAAGKVIRHRKNSGCMAVFGIGDLAAFMIHREEVSDRVLVGSVEIIAVHGAVEVRGGGHVARHAVVAGHDIGLRIGEAHPLHIVALICAEIIGRKTV